MPNHLTIALAQYSIDRDPAAVVQEARNAGAEVVVFPEMFSNGYVRFDPADARAFERWQKGAQTFDGTFVTKFRDAAKNHKMHVVATFLENADPKPFNSAILIDLKARAFCIIVRSIRATSTGSVPMLLAAVASDSTWRKFRLPQGW